MKKLDIAELRRVEAGETFNSQFISWDNGLLKIRSFLLGGYLKLLLGAKNGFYLEFDGWDFKNNTPDTDRDFTIDLTRKDI